MRSLSQREKAKCLKRLSDLLHRGYALMQALDILSRSGTTKERFWLKNISASLAEGKTIEQAFSQAGFSTFVVLMIAQAEVHGKLADALGKASEWKLKRIQLKQELRKALVYPFALLIVAGVVFYLIMYFIMPQFQYLFRTFDVTLPRSTAFILSLYRWLAENGLLVLAVLFLSLLAAFWGCRKWAVRMRVLRAGLKTPGIKNILQVFYSVLFSVQLGYLLQARVPLHESLRKVTVYSKSPLLKQTLAHIEENILKGMTLGEAIEDVHLFTAEMHPVVYYAERNGQLAEQLVEYGLLLERESIDRWIGQIKWIEPILLVGMGGLIAYLFLALLTPVMRLIEAL